MNEYIQRIIAIIIEKTGIEPEDITEESYFGEDLNIAELELVEILGIVEEEYSIVFEEGEVDNVKSVMDLVELVFEKLE